MIGANQGRILKITEKLNGINLRFEQDRGIRVEQIENKLRSVDNKFSSYQELHTQRHTQLRDQLSRLQRLIDEEHTLRDSQIDSKIREMLALEEKYSYQIEQEIKVNEFDQGQAGDARAHSEILRRQDLEVQERDGLLQSQQRRRL
jgi:hypothetical protein